MAAEGEKEPIVARRQLAARLPVFGSRGGGANDAKARRGLSFRRPARRPCASVSSAPVRAGPAEKGRRSLMIYGNERRLCAAPVCRTQSPAGVSAAARGRPFEASQSGAPKVASRESAPQKSAAK